MVLNGVANYLWRSTFPEKTVHDNEMMATVILVLVIDLIKYS